MAYIKTTPDIVNEIQKNVELLVQKAEDAIPTPIKLIPIISPKSISISPQTLFYLKHVWDVLSITQIQNKLKNHFDVIDAEIKSEKIHENHAINLESIKVNQAIKDKIVFIMNSIGIYDTYSTYEYKTVRSNNKTETKHTAGYITDLNRVISNRDNYDNVIRNINEHKKSTEAYANKLIADITKQEKDQLALKTLEEKNKILTYLSVKYELGTVSQYQDVLSAILSKSNLLNLAHAMLKTRNHSSGGFYKVEDAVFNPTNEIETNIINEIRAILESDESDGRVFRDCMFNYDVIFKMVDEKLYEDYTKLMVYEYE